jgi:hypothetical protein
MGIDLDDKLVETATKVTVTRNGFGDTIYGNTTSRPCLYRDISTLASGSNAARNRESVQLDGILWFGAGETIYRGDIYYHPDEGYLKIETITRAKRLVADNTTQFIKCGVSKQRQVS